MPPDDLERLERRLSFARMAASVALAEVDEVRLLVRQMLGPGVVTHDGSEPPSPVPMCADDEPPGREPM